MESAGLMPMTALAYGTIPIISIVGGLYDTFNSENCIEVYDNDVKAAITRAANLYQDKKEFRKMRNVCMSQDISWITRKQDYINLYEN
jgi:glycogen synthase